MAGECVASAAVLLWHAFPFTGADEQRRHWWLMYRTLPVQPVLLLLLSNKLLRAWEFWEEEGNIGAVYVLLRRQVYQAR